MKAIVLKEYGNNLKLEDIPRPIINDDEILVKVKNTGVNHLDRVEASGLISAIFPIKLPWIPGREFSGIVEETGKNVKSFKAGDTVFGNSELGAYAEYLALKPEVIVLKPDNISFAEAASVPVASQTAWQGVFTHGGLAKG
jgi:NADPH:quinone reductase-like Zn-dependent oxidoreductase